VQSEKEIYRVRLGTRQTQNKTMKQYIKPKKIISSLQPRLCGDISLSRIGILRGVFLPNHLASTDKLTRTTKREHMETNATQNAALQ